METTAYEQSQTDNVDDLVRDYLPLVKKIGLHLVARMPPEIELDDMMQVVENWIGEKRKKGKLRKVRRRREDF